MPLMHWTLHQPDSGVTLQFNFDLLASGIRGVLLHGDSGEKLNIELEMTDTSLKQLEKLVKDAEGQLEAPGFPGMGAGTLGPSGEVVPGNPTPTPKPIAPPVSTEQPGGPLNDPAGPGIIPGPSPTGVTGNVGPIGVPGAPGFNNLTVGSASIKAYLTRLEQKAHSQLADIATLRSLIG